MPKRKFKIGQQVFTLDPTYGRVNGEVVGTTDKEVIIKWKDCSMPINHPIVNAFDIKINRKCQN